MVSGETSAGSAGEAVARPKGRRGALDGWLYSVRMALQDFVLANVAFALAWWLRYERGMVSEVTEQNYLSLADYLGIELAFAVFLLAACGLKGLYRESLGRTWLDEVSVIVSSTIISTALMIVVIFYYRPFSYSRAVFIFALVAAVFLLATGRLLDRQAQAALRKRGRGLKNVVIVGAGSLGRRIMQSMVAQPDLGYRVVGFVDDVRREDIGRFRALGPLASTSEVVGRHDVDEVIIALPAVSHQEVVRIIRHCASHNVQFRLVPDFYELSLDRVGVDYLHGIPLIGLREPSLSGWKRLTKRAVDVAVALVALALLSPVMLVVALAIKVDSPGPVVFRQQRVGRGGRQFSFYKFRSMRADAEDAFWRLVEMNEVKGPIFKIRQDPRTTRVGRVIRRTSIDELPQLFNVLKGDMSLVGPRPPIPHEVERYEDWHRKRLQVSPGITGLWQVSGRSQLTFDEMVLLDLWYIDNWSLMLDLQIIARTIPAVLLERGAY